MATIGTDDRIEPKIGIRLMVAAIPASSSGYFTWKMQQADVGERAVDAGRSRSWPRITPDRPAIDAGDDAVVVALVLLGHQRAQEALDADRDRPG